MIKSNKTRSFEPHIKWNNKSITFYKSPTQKEKLSWDKLETIHIVTTDDGPYNYDFFWILLDDKENGIVVPQGIRGEEKLLQKLGKFPEFNHTAVIEASYSVENNKFLCWNKN